MDVVPVQRPDRLSSVPLLGAAAELDAKLTGTFASCVEQLIAQTASKHKEVSKSPARLLVLAHMTSSCCAFKWRGTCGVSGSHLRWRWSEIQSRACVTSALIRSIGSCARN